jgi:hypothetical protein
MKWLMHWCQDREKEIDRKTKKEGAKIQVRF